MLPDVWSLYYIRKAVVAKPSPRKQKRAGHIVWWEEFTGIEIQEGSFCQEYREWVREAKVGVATGTPQTARQN